MADNGEPNSPKLQEFIKRLIATDNQIKQIRKGIMGVNVSKDDRYLKSERYKRSIKWRHGPRLLFTKQKTDEKRYPESKVEEEARHVQKEAEETQEKATKVEEHAVSKTDFTATKTTPHHTFTHKFKTIKHIIPTSYKDFLEKHKKKTTIKCTIKKEHIRKKINGAKREIATTERMIRNPTIAILIPKRKIYAVYDESHRKITKCTHVHKEHSHEEHLKHPYYKNTEHLDRFLDMLLDVNNSRIHDPQMNEIFKKKKTKCKHPSVVVGPIKLIQEKSKVELNMDNAREELVKMKKLLTMTQNTLKSTYKMLDDTSTITMMSTTTPRLPEFITKSVSPKYDIFMSILTVNPDQHTPVTEDIRSLADRKLYSRRLMQLEEEVEDLNPAYEDLKEVLADDKMKYDDNHHKTDKKSNIDDLVLASEELLRLHVIKPTHMPRPKLFNPNWKGPIGLFPDELNLLMKPYKYSKKIPIRNNEVPEENGEDESVFNNVDYVEDYSTSLDGLAKRAQAYSDYGVLAKEADIILANKNIPSQDSATTKTQKLSFEVDLNPSIKVKRSKRVKQPADIKVNKNFVRIGRSLMSVKKTDTDDDFDGTITDDLINRGSKSRGAKNTGIKIKSLTKHKHSKKHKINKALLHQLVDFEKKKQNTGVPIITYEDETTNNDLLTTLFDDGDVEDYNQNYTQVTDAVDTLTLVNDDSDITNPLGTVLNTSLLNDIFQKLKVPTMPYYDINDKVESFLATSDELTKTTEKYKVKSTEYSPKTTKGTSDVLTTHISKTTADIIPEKVSEKTTDIFNNIESVKISDMLKSIDSEKTTFMFNIIVTEKTTSVTDNTIDVSELMYDPTEMSKTDQFYTNTESITDSTSNAIFDNLFYDEQTTNNYNSTTDGMFTSNIIEGEDIISVNKEKDLFSYLANWLCAIVGAVSNVSTTTVYPRFEENNRGSLERKYRTRTLKSVNNHDSNSSDIVTDAPKHSLSTNVMNITISLNENMTTKDLKSKGKDKTNEEEREANKTLVKRNADAGSNFVYFSDIYDEDYGIDLPFDKTEKRKNKMFLKKQKEWIRKKVKKINEKLHSNPYNKMLMVKQRSKLGKDDESMMMFNDTRIRRDSANTREFNPINGAIIDFNVLNSKLKEICTQAADEVQQMRKLQAAREDINSNPTSSLMQQLAQLMSDLVDLQVKQKTCRKLPPDLQKFLIWLTSPEPQKQPMSKSMVTQGGGNGEFADAELLEDMNDYSMAGLHDLEASLRYPSTTEPSVDILKPQCVNAIQSVENLLYEYDKLSPANKNRIAGVKDYLNNQLIFLRNQVDEANELTSIDNDAMRFRRDTNNAKPNSGRDKRKFVRHFSRKHTKTTANNIDDSQSATEQLQAVGLSEVTIDDRQKVKGKEYVTDNDRDKRNLRDVYYRALSKSNKFSTSTTTEKHRQA